MNLTLTAYGIAKDIIQGRTTTLEVEGPTTLAQVKAVLCERYPSFQELASLAIAVNATYQADDFVVQAHDELVIIPPVSGG